MAKESMEGGSPVPNPFRPNVWGMIRDVMLGSLEKGQFLIAIFGGIVVILLVKSRPIDGQKTLDGIGAVFNDLANFGWVLFIVSVALFYLIIRFLRKSHIKEITELKGRCAKLEKLVHAGKKKTNLDAKKKA